jgi:signal transduction histidine kinase
MSPRTRKHIYDASVTTKGTSGTGSGLWIAAGILAMHGGSMHLRSNEFPGRSGTAFTLIFPLHLRFALPGYALQFSA